MCMAFILNAFAIDQSNKERPLVVILLGPPGAGKGTHALPLSEKLGLPHISTGDLFRENLRNNTPLGKKIKKFMDQGKLVPDDLVLDMLFARLSAADCQKGYILDGFPRTLPQARAFDKKISNKIKLIALNFSVPDSILIERVTGRLSCEKCGASFHKKFSPPKAADTCDNCKTTLSTRADDNAETMKERLKAYRESSQPLLGYYEGRNILFDINSQKSKQEVFEEVLQTVEGVLQPVGI